MGYRLPRPPLLAASSTAASLLAASLLICTAGFSQSVPPSPSAAVPRSTATAHQGPDELRDLTLLHTDTASGLKTGAVLLPPTCDSDGNVYLLDVIDGRTTMIHKLSPAGKPLALFQPDLAAPEFKKITALHFSVGENGPCINWLVFGMTGKTTCLLISPVEV
jgi:hypothetical protein